MRRLALSAITVLAAGAAHAQPAALLDPSRIAQLPPEERAAWERYVETSRRQAAAEREIFVAELGASGAREPLPAPSGSDFHVTARMTPEWFAGEEARRMADVILTWQTPSGGWSKAVALDSPRRPGQHWAAQGGRWHYVGTFDNGATTEHLRFLAAADRGQDVERWRSAFLRGVDYVFRAQFPNGCWPQVYPLEGGYHDAATFNDDATLRILRLLRDVERGEVPFVADEVRRRAGESVARGIGCILRSQVMVDGRRTVWGAQHDPLTLRPVGARSFEPAALSGKEGPALLAFLMELDTDDPRVAQAVREGAGWVRETMQWGYTRRPGEKPVPTPGAGPLWARFYEIGSNRPVFANRDGRVTYDWRELADSAWGYGWYTDEPAAVLARYDVWAAARVPGPLPRGPSRVNVMVDARHAGADGEMVGTLPTYRTIGAAVAAAPADGRTAFIIAVADGRYREKLSIDKPNIHLVGQGRDGTVLTYDVAAGHTSPGGWVYGTRGSWTLRVAAPGFRLERMTVENAFDYPGNEALPEGARVIGTQAVAVMLDSGSDRAVFRDCRLSGHQDTLFPNAGGAYFQRCEILGSVDFIFGAGRAVFDDCDIVSRDRRSGTSNGYVTAPSTPISQPYGFLFLGGRLRKETAEMAPGSVTLGRPWHPSGRPDAIGSAVFIDTWMDDHIGATGWSPMNSTDAAGHRVENRPEDARFFEFGTTGPGAVSSPSRRVLTPEQAAEYTIARVLDGWDPHQ